MALRAWRLRGYQESDAPPPPDSPPPPLDSPPPPPDAPPPPELSKPTLSPLSLIDQAGSLAVPKRDCLSRNSTGMQAKAQVHVQAGHVDRGSQCVPTGFPISRHRKYIHGKTTYATISQPNEPEKVPGSFNRAINMGSATSRAKPGMPINSDKAQKTRKITPPMLASGTPELRNMHQERPKN
jgi:hypothetical protein